MEKSNGLIIGKGNCGKTTLLLNLLLQPNWLDFNHLYLFANTLHQQEYQVMKKGFNSGLSKQQISNIFRNQNGNIAAKVRESHVRRE